MSPSPPLRFLILLLAGWSGMRAAMLAPAWWVKPADAGGRPLDSRATAARTGIGFAPGDPGPVLEQRLAAGRRRDPDAPRRSPPRKAPAAAAAAEPPPLMVLAWQLTPAAAASRWRAQPTSALPASTVQAERRPRWSLALWSFLRQGDADMLAPGGMLGGSQAGAKLAYRLNRRAARPLALAARLTAPIRRPSGAEAALGIDWQPSRRVALHLVGERRQKLGREGRSAFAFLAYGGVGDAPLGRVRIDAYAQAGMVGMRSRDLFGDGALRLSLPFGARLRVGAGAWAAAQPGVARLDLGPQASLRLPVSGRTATVSVDWRQRVAGNARPGSGPTITLATDF